MGQLHSLLRIAPLAGLLLIAADQWRHGDTTHAMLALALATLAMR